MRRPGGRARRTVVAGSATAVALLAASAFALWGPGRGTEPDDPGATAARETATVTRETLVERTSEKGTLGYGESAVHGTQGSGTVTWLPDVGSVVGRGEPLFRVDERPVVLLVGVLPMYRDLGPGARGEDVRQLEANLTALGYGGFTEDDRFTDQTSAAVRQWQKDLGVERTGRVGPDLVLVQPGPLRVAEHEVPLGAPAGPELVATTGTERSVVVDLDLDRRRLAVEGAAVSVRLPDGTTVDGTVTAVGPPETSDDPNGVPGAETTTVPVTVVLADGADAAEDGPVKVELVSAERADVLTVPVAALLALAEGGYGVEVVDEGASGPGRVVAVGTGMFADGRVEVTGELAEGDTVVVPS